MREGGAPTVDRRQHAAHHVARIRPVPGHTVLSAEQCPLQLLQQECASPLPALMEGGGDSGGGEVLFDRSPEQTSGAAGAN